MIFPNGKPGLNKTIPIVDKLEVTNETSQCQRETVDFNIAPWHSSLENLFNPSISRAPLKVFSVSTILAKLFKI